MYFLWVFFGQRPVFQDICALMSYGAYLPERSVVMAVE